jgi:hypothetical protein
MGARDSEEAQGMRVLRHSERLVLVAVLVGLLWYAFIVGFGNALPEPWNQFGDSGVLDHVLLAASFVLAVLVPAWLCRRILASMTFGRTFPLSVLALLPVALCFVSALFLSDALFGGEIEELQDVPTLLGKLAMSVFIIFFWTVWMVASAVEHAGFFLPLAWLSTLALRWASGAREEGESTPRPRSPQRSS